MVAEARAQPVMRIARGNLAGEQPGGMDAIQLADMARIVQHLDLRGVRQEHAHHGLVVFEMEPEIAERIGVVAFHDGQRSR